jgi:hypothetical protein
VGRHTAAARFRARSEDGRWQRRVRYIALQSEGHPIQFRRVELLNLEGCMDQQASNFKTYYVEPDAASCER